jgi:hypothetical protein
LRRCNERFEARPRVAMQSDFVMLGYDRTGRANPIEHSTAATIYAAVAVSADPERPADVPRTKIPTVVRMKENALRDAATDSVVRTKLDDERDECQHVEGCNPR